MDKASVDGGQGGSGQDLSLVVGGRRELLALLGRDGGVARDQPREDATWFGVGVED